MLNDLDELIKKLLVQGVPLDTSEIDVVFDAPTSEWKSSLARPTVNCYLYHIIENHELRRTDWEMNRNPNGRPDGSVSHSLSRRRMPYRMDASYMITAWANAVEDEHRLLWRVLAALMRYNSIPQEFLEGELENQAWALPIKVAQPEAVFKNPSDFWSGMEVHVKPGINVAITVALDPERYVEMPLVLTRRVKVFPTDDKTKGYELPTVQFGGWVMRKEDGTSKPVSDVDVLIVEQARTAVTDEYGRFKFDHVPRGRYTLRVTSGSEQSERQVDVPGDDYDLVLNGHVEREANSSDGGGNREEPPTSQQGGSKGRRR